MSTANALALALAFTASMAVQAEDTPQISGWIETASLPKWHIALPAKLDTGADNSSLCAEQLTNFEKDGEPWVRFVVSEPDGKSTRIEAKVVRSAQIKRHRGDREVRPVVKLGLCVGKIYREVEVNLVDRRKFQYPLLIGRSFMAGHIMVDPSRTNLAAPACEDHASPYCCAMLWGSRPSARSCPS